MDIIDPDTLINEIDIAQNTLQKNELILADLLRQHGLSENHLQGGLKYYRNHLSRFEKYLNDPQLAVSPIINNINNSKDKPYRGDDTHDSEHNYSQDDIDAQLFDIRDKWIENNVSKALIIKGLRMLDNWIKKIEN